MEYSNNVLIAICKTCGVYFGRFFKRILCKISAVSSYFNDYVFGLIIGDLASKNIKLKEKEVNS